MDAGILEFLAVGAIGAISWLLLRKATGPAARKCLGRNVSSALRPGQDNDPEHRAQLEGGANRPLPISATMLARVSTAST
jgi:hypothetical protein